MDQNPISDRFGMLPHLAQACMRCGMCGLGWRQVDHGTGKLDPHVFSNYKPIFTPQRFMIVGQNPGLNEVVRGEPFVGAAGENFNKALLQTMWRRDNFYITNAVKCHTEGNRVPTAQQMEACEPFLRMEMAIVKPILVVALGSVAHNILCPDVAFSDAIGRVNTSHKFDVKIFTTYHPSPLNLADRQRRIQFHKDIRLLGRVMDKYLTPF